MSSNLFVREIDFHPQMVPARSHWQTVKYMEAQRCRNNCKDITQNSEFGHISLFKTRLFVNSPYIHQSRWDLSATTIDYVMRRKLNRCCYDIWLPAPILSREIWLVLSPFIYRFYSKLTVFMRLTFVWSPRISLRTSVWALISIFWPLLTIHSVNN